MDKNNNPYKIENDFEQVQEPFVFDENNITDRTLEYIKTDKYKYERKSASRRVIFLSLIFVLLFQMTAVLVHVSLSYFTRDQGIQSILTVLISIAPLIIIFKNRIGNSLRREREKFKISDLVYFFGIMYLLSIVFSNIASFLMNQFNIGSVNVTADITGQMNIPLFIYAVLLGPYLEELQFRGYYMNYLRKYGASFTILLTSITFSFMHLNFLQSIGTLGIAIVIGYVGYFYSFKAAVLLHMLNNLFAFGMSYILKEYGEDSTIATVVSLIIIALIIQSIIRSFSKKRRELYHKHMGHYRKNRNRKIFEDDSLYGLLSDWMFWLYLIFMLSISIFIGTLI